LRSAVGSRLRTFATAWLAIAALAPCAEAQSRPRLDIERADGSRRSVAVQLDRGYAVVPLSVLGELGWNVGEEGSAISLRAANQISISMRAGSPFFTWDGVVLQLTDSPYRVGGTTYVPVQLLTDFLPRRLPGLYDFAGSESLLRAGDLALLGADGMAGGAPRPGPGDGAAGGGAPTTRLPPPRPAPNSAEEVRTAGPSPYDGVRVVVIDAGHGGEDPGAMGPDGIREKTVALGIALRQARALEGVANLEVHMIRDDDTFVDVWDRGQIATEAKGERPGIFVSIHANSFPARREARGFETYFLSDARTEHERRVAAIENAPLSMRSADAVDAEQLAELDFILRDLKNYDHAHWSEHLASLVQDELGGFHPGPNRGVKQSVLAVLTNALMPAVLVEIGYLSNDSEARLIARDDFHQSSAEAIADAIVRFFERYPPGSGTGGGREER
jgi:N-acetylmuramoyl-L-alanine amidase